MTTVLSFLFVLGVLVFVHELGHFLAAKRVGIRVIKFQLGFNPTIVSFRRGDTEYGIGALPLGGYVKMAGETTEDEPAGQPDEFLSKTRWERFQVLIMGPVMNLLLAFVLTAVVLYQGAEVGTYEDQPVVVGSVSDGFARRARRHRARRSHRVGRRSPRRHLGAVLHHGRRAAEPRDHDRPAAQRPRRHAQADAGRAARPEPVRDRRHRRAAERAPAPRLGERQRARRPRRPHGGRRHRGRRRPDDDVPHAVPRSHRQASRQDDGRLDSARRQPDDADDHARHARDGGLARRAAGGRHAEHQADGRRGARAERAAQRADGRDDRPDDLGPGHAAALAQAADGADRDRAGVGRDRLSWGGSRSSA